MLAALCGAAVLGLGGGCIVGRPMAYAPGAPPVALGAQEGLAVGTLKLSNTWKTGCQPHAKSVVVKAQAGEGASTRFQTVPFRTNAAEKDQWEEFLVALPLAPGGYTFTEVVSGAQCGIVFGSGLFRVDAPFRVEPGKAVYVGRIEALRRERKRDDEPRAGSVIPLIDQAVTGFSGGTFDVRVVDAFDADVALLKSGFAPLANVQIDKALMGTVGSTAAR
jgi:hypothetical protein